MNLIEEIFDRFHPIIRKLKSYGFTEDDNGYSYSEPFLNGSFEAIIKIDRSNKITAKVIEKELNEEYTNIYSSSFYGGFVGEVRDNFVTILNDVKKHCFEKDLFIYPQTKRIVSYMEKQYQCKPEFLFKKYPDYAVFKNSLNKKWFAVIMNVKAAKLSVNDEREVEVIDVKADPETVSSLTDNKRFFPAYHMNKDKWLTIILNDSVDDEIIFSMIDYSFRQNEESDEWLIPANPEYYDMKNLFSHSPTQLWKQSSNIKTGDIVYLYVGKPISAILYKCLVEETDIPYEYMDKNISMRKVMRLSLLKKYKKDKLSYAYLNTLGIRFVRGPRRISKQISKLL